MLESGNGRPDILTFEHIPQRVVSLIPSMTESLFDLDLGDYLVGITDFCEPPEEAQTRLVRVGGTKSPLVERIVKLKPDLVLANMEENSKQTVEKLEARGLKVWVTFPKSIQETIDLLHTLLALFRATDRIERIRTMEIILDWTQKAVKNQPKIRVFCPIWMGKYGRDVTWFMTFNRQTYPHDVLLHCGAENVFGERERRYPLAADLGLKSAQEPGHWDTRYPRVGVDEVLKASPELILLPSEPFSFENQTKDRLRHLLAETPAVKTDRVQAFDGRLITWHGTRLGKALHDLPSLIAVYY